MGSFDVLLGGRVYGPDGMDDMLAVEKKRKRKEKKRKEKKERKKHHVHFRFFLGSFGARERKKGETHAGRLCPAVILASLSGSKRR